MGPRRLRLGDFSSFRSIFFLSTVFRSGKTALRSLLLVSHKLHSFWSPISVQNVTLWIYQLPSFLRFLLKRPELGSKVRSLNFVTTKGTEIEHAREAVIELITMGHPRIMETEREPSPLSVIRILGEARALIVEHCTELRASSLDSKMAFPLSLSGPPKLIFSERLTSIKTVDFSTDPNDTRSLWTGRQALTLLIFLPSLQFASMAFKFDYQDASVINTHLPPLIESGRAVSNVKKLSLKFYQHFPRHSYHIFNYDSTLNTFFSILKSLENISLTFIEISRIHDPVVSQAPQFPTTDLVEGFIGSSTTLKSLSVEGQSIGSAEGKVARDERFWSFLRRFKKLEHFRFDSIAFFSASISQGGVYKGPDIKSLELADNYTDWQPERTGNNVEVFFCPMLLAGYLPKSLKLIKSPRRHLIPVNQANSVNVGSGEQFQSAREEFLEAAAEAGVMVEFYD